MPLIKFPNFVRLKESLETGLESSKGPFRKLKMVFLWYSPQVVVALGFPRLLNAFLALPKCGRLLRYIFKELVGFKKMNQDMVPSVGISE